MKRIVLKHISGSKANHIEEFLLHLCNEIVIGRDPSCTVKYDPGKDDLVGRQHAKITPDPMDSTQFILRDLNSRNGSFVNKQRVTSVVKWTPGDVLRFGAGGPELMFDLDPRPENFVAATRVGVAAFDNAAGATREAAVATLPTPNPAGTNPMNGTAPKSVGKATLERAIQQTKTESRVTLFASVGALLVVTALAIGGITW